MRLRRRRGFENERNVAIVKRRYAVIGGGGAQRWKDLLGLGFLGNEREERKENRGGDMRQ